MPPLPDVSVQIQDGALGLVPQNLSGPHVKLGVCSLGAPNAIYSFSDPKQLQTALGTGPLVECAAYALSVGGGPVYVVPVNASVAAKTGPVLLSGGGAPKVGATVAYQPTTGAAATSAVTQVGTGPAVTVTGTNALGNYAVLVTVVLGGIVGTATYTYSVDGGVTTSGVVTTAATVALNDLAGNATGLTLTFAAGTYVLGTTYAFTSALHAPAGAGTVAIALAAGASAVLGNYVVQVTIALGGATGTATFTYSLDGGITQNSGTLTTGANVALPGTNLVATFAGTFTAADQYQAVAVGKTGVGAGTAALAVSGSALDAYQVAIAIVTGGANLAAAVAQFTYSLDAGQTTSATIAVPTGGTYAIPGTGLTVTFKNGQGTGTSFVAGDTFAFYTQAPGFSASDLNTALAALLADARTWGFLHVVGQAATASGTATIAAAVATVMTTAEGNFRFAWALVESADDSDANQIAAFASFASSRISVAAGFAGLVSTVTGRIAKRHAGWPIVARAAKKPLAEDLGRVASGPLDGVRALYRDEYATPGLDAARFATLRSIIGRQGFYVTNGNLMAATGSDFTLVQRRQVMDLGCAVGRNALLQFLNDSIRVNATTGFIDERDARLIETYVLGQLNAALLQPGYVSAVSVAVNRNDNLLSNPTVRAKLRLTPLGYAKSIVEDIGFYNPALAVKTS